jgi:hypothetical protein
MYTYTEKLNDNITLIKTRILDICYTCGMIEEGYNGNVFMVTGLNNETLKDGDSVIFKDFKKAQDAIIEAFIKEFDL